MKRQIYKNLLLLACVSMVFVATVLCYMFYHQFAATVRLELREQGETFRNKTAAAIIDSLAEARFRADLRLSIVTADGTVLYDSDVAAGTLENHADREEIKAALANGFGESKRFSNTLGQEHYYYALKLQDGTVLRLAKTLDSIGAMLGKSWLIIVLALGVVLVLGYALAGRLTNKIVTSLDEVNLAASHNAPYDELVPFVRKIINQHGRTEARLDDLQKRSDTIQTIISGMQEGIVLIDHQGIIFFANQSVLKLFEATENMNGRSVLELLRDIELIKNVKQALAGRSSEIFYERYEKIYQTFFSPATDRGAIILFLDVTDKTVAEKIRKQFTANVSHELKTPLTAISGYAEMINNGMVKEADLPGFAGKIRDEAVRLLSLIEDIIMLSELDEKTEIPARKAVDLAEVAAEVREALSLKAARNSVRIDLQANSGFLLQGNRSMLHEMLYNLVDNGIKYNRPGGVVTVDLSKSDKELKLTVSDTGIGIPKEHQERIFERFYRVDSSRSKKTGGTGLGLSIVKHIVAVHGGCITMKSQEHEGTSISVTMPIC